MTEQQKVVVLGTSLERVKATGNAIRLPMGARLFRQERPYRLVRGTRRRKRAGRRIP